MAVDFPSSPTPGQVYTQAGATWTWDGVKWVAQGTGTGIYLPLTGGVMTGDITLKGDPSAPLHPVTYRMVSNPNDNRIINGDMRIDQRNNGASGTAIGYTVDRWQFAASLATKGTWGRNFGSPSLPPGFPYCLNFTSGSAYAPLASDTFAFDQAIEADMISDFQWGAVNAQPVTLSFWFISNQTGTFSGSICNYAATRSYPFTFSGTNVWTKFVITIPGDTAGAWVLSGNSGGLHVRFDLGSGATYRSAAGAWTAGNFVGATGAVSLVATSGAYAYLTGVKLEIGSVATPFNRQSLAKSMADCQRYYQQLGGSANSIVVRGYGGASGVVASSIGYPTMRAAPTVASIGSFTATNCTMTYYPGVSSVGIMASALAVGQVDFYNAANAYMTLSAEL